jgi:hypothetical protein
MKRTLVTAAALALLGAACGWCALPPAVIQAWS